MSQPIEEAVCLEHASPAVELSIRGRPRDLGGFSVRRMLPAARRRRVGPFVFFDHMGPTLMAAGTGIDVRPHPHIGLATVTYLFEGEIMHRDSLGSAQTIRPGDVNWMVAGRGIVHSERTAPERRATAHALDGIQAWIALPNAHEECEPAFFHHDAASLPRLSRAGAELVLIAGHAFGLQSPVQVASPTLYVDARLAAGASLELPLEHEERALYVVSGSVMCQADTFAPGEMVVLRPGQPVQVHAANAAHVLLLGGAPLDGERHLWWNFVSSSEARLEQAKSAWREGRFLRVPGDDVEFIPLPEG